MRPPAVPAVLAFLLAALVTLACPAAAQRGGCLDAAPSGSTLVVAPADEPGERLTITGRVHGPDGEPLSGTRVRVFQTDAAGYYSPGGMDEANARLCGVLETAADGTYEVRTVRPGRYATGGPAAHVHFEVTLPGGRGRMVTVHFPDDVVENGDPAAGDRAAGSRPLVRVDGGLAAVFDLRVGG